MKPKKLPFKEFKRIYSKVPRLCVDLVVKTKNGVVLSKRSIEPSKGMWHFPGGTVLWEEKLEDAISRVAEEEMGLEVKVEKIIETIEYLDKSPHKHTVSIAFLIKPISGSLRGSSQGEKIKYHKTIPKNIIKEQKEFIEKHKLI